MPQCRLGLLALLLILLGCGTSSEHVEESGSDTPEVEAENDQSEPDDDLDEVLATIDELIARGEYFPALDVIDEHLGVDPETRVVARDPGEEIEQRIDRLGRLLDLRRVARAFVDAQEWYYTRHAEYLEPAGTYDPDDPEWDQLDAEPEVSGPIEIAIEVGETPTCELCGDAGAPEIPEDRPWHVVRVYDPELEVSVLASSDVEVPEHLPGNWNPQ